jgi:LysR family cys regulon transcriptional activator
MLGELFSNKVRGQLVLATTHTQARYTLPRVVTEFKKQYPKVNLVLHEASPGEIVSMLRGGQADIGIASEALQDATELAAFPYYNWHHGVVVPRGHGLDTDGDLTLEALADWPLITYSEGFTGRSKIDKAFQKDGIAPDIVLSALDADVIKAYVELGLGIGIVASHAFDPLRDTGLRLIDADHLFEANVSRIAVRRGTYLRGYAFRFIEYCSPKLTEHVVRTGIDTPAE